MRSDSDLSYVGSTAPFFKERGADCNQVGVGSGFVGSEPGFCVGSMINPKPDPKLSEALMLV